MRIEKLTKEQIDSIPLFIDKWVKKGLSTKQLSTKEITKIVNNFNKYILKEKEKPVFIFNSPIEAWFFICLNQVRNQVRNQVWNQVGIQVENQVRNQVRNQVWNQV
ncbi:MAG: hypothetical protein AABY22_15955, partial [Nanoarchaeota archaeon]